MFDPALIDGLQRAMAPPAIMPPAIERAWVSPMAAEGERTTEPWLLKAEEDSFRWRSGLREFLETVTTHGTDDIDNEKLEALDTFIVVADNNIKQTSEEADRHHREGMRVNKVLARQDFSAAAVQKRQIIHFDKMYGDNIEVLRELVVKLRNYRAMLDPRTGAEPGYELKPWTPNTATANAMREAIAGVGMRRVGSVAEMMAELHAEDD